MIVGGGSRGSGVLELCWEAKRNTSGFGFKAQAQSLEIGVLELI